MMRTVVGATLLLVGAVMASGCATTSPAVSGLIADVRSEVAPSLVDELRENAHLKGRPFVFVPYRDGRPDTEMNDLGRQVQLELVEACLPHPDVRLRRQHPLDLPDQPHRPTEVDCGDLSTDVDMLVGLELRPRDAGMWELVLTADTSDGARLPLLIRHPFRPTPEELAATRRSARVAGAAGTRVQPFPGPGDDMARFLARNLVCTGSLWGDDVLFDTSSITCEADTEVIALTAGHLRQMAMVEVVDEPGDEVVEIAAAAHGDGGARLLWLTGPDGVSVRAFYQLPDGSPCAARDASATGDVIAVGVASWRDQIGSSQAVQKRRAVTAAEMDARRQLLEQVGPVTVEGSTTVEDLLLTGEVTRQRVSGIVRTRRVGEPRYDDEQGTVEVTLRLDREHLVESLRGAAGE
jgi:hypothetical protein